jgi:hypothetical protein
MPIIHVDERSTTVGVVVGALEVVAGGVVDGTTAGDVVTVVAGCGVVVVITVVVVVGSGAITTPFPHCAVNVIFESSLK